MVAYRDKQFAILYPKTKGSQFILSRILHQNIWFHRNVKAQFYMIKTTSAMHYSFGLRLDKRLTKSITGD